MTATTPRPGEWVYQIDVPGAEMWRSVGEAHRESGKFTGAFRAPATVRLGVSFHFDKAGHDIAQHSWSNLTPLNSWTSEHPILD